MQRQWHILVVDDDPEITELLKDYLQKHGFRVSSAHNSIEMQKLRKQHRFDLYVLDIMMPGEDGLSICRKMREDSDEQALIIILSAMGEETDRIVGLEVGADDYLAKPFSPRELLARIKSLQRLTAGPASKVKTRKLTLLPNIRFDNWLLDQNKRRLLAPDDLHIPLSGGEYDLLLAFLENPHRILTRDQLLDLTHERAATPFDRTIDVQVGRLRKKIEVNPKKPLLIKTVRGGGYQFTADVKVEEE